MISPSPAVTPCRPVRRVRPSTRGRRVLRITAVVLWASVLTLGASASDLSDPPTAMPESASEAQLRWQPATDYEADGCYPTPAISRDGVPASGLTVGGGLAEDCSDGSDLRNANAYVRTWCQGSWCAHKYAYYFEKDQELAHMVGPAGGHRHDWEHIVVWVQDDVLRFVAVSGHGGYRTRPAADVDVFEGTHPKVVYDKDGSQTHRFRHAGPGDEPPDNALGTWQLPALVGWVQMDPGVRDVLATHDFDAGTLALTDSEYADDLRKSLTDERWREVGALTGPDPSAAQGRCPSGMAGTGSCAARGPG